MWRLGLDTVGLGIVMIMLVSLMFAVLILQRQRSQKTIAVWLAASLIGILLGSAGTLGALRLSGYRQFGVPGRAGAPGSTDAGTTPGGSDPARSMGGMGAGMGGYGRRDGRRHDGSRDDGRRDGRPESQTRLDDPRPQARSAHRRHRHPIDCQNKAHR